MQDRPKIEVCVDSVSGALAAEAGGADRLELCANLQQGGTTPSSGLLAAVRAATQLPLMVMIRPRPGDFCYDDQELDVMQRDIAAALTAGATGIVIGALLPNGDIDRRVTGALVAAASAPVTFHRAFDLARDPQASLEVLIELGVERLLTSGQQPSASQGAANIAAWIRQVAGRLVVMPGCGVDESTIQPILKETGASEVHFSARVASASPVLFRRPEIPMVSPSDADEYLRWVTSPSRVRTLCELARSCRL